ncbi:hypothetical protein [Nocardia amikacinitolerans]|uniref:hypothetical protein n=1 Tax=Nocardia amikacinitolerans TaxID=756689 RepID=UPI0020A26542|nr:hypothetical protein [Nocardia amikacinitolerans]
MPIPVGRAATSGTTSWERGGYYRVEDVADLDTIGQGERRYYAVDVPTGATAYFTGIVSFPRVPGVSVTDDFNTLQSRV